jgi:3-oxocholest-4-en-26-oate---CoA ligase
MNGPTLFDLSTVFSVVAGAVPDQDMMVWRERRLTYGEVDRRIDALAEYLRTVGLGCHTERKHLARHESGQDHLGIYPSRANPDRSNTAGLNTAGNQ